MQKHYIIITDAESYALSEVTKEVVFVKLVLEAMGIKLNLPIKIKVENFGEIYLAKNFSLSQNTKHISQRIHWKRYSCVTKANS
jgi:hypothetical protein